MSRSLVRRLVRTVLADKAPVPFSSSRLASIALPFIRHNDLEYQLQSMGQVGIIFSIVNSLATATSQVNWHLYRKARSGKPEDRVEVTVHPALSVLNNPNAFFTRQELVEAGQQHQELTGETWLVIGRNPKVPDLPLELWPVRPDRIRPVPDADNFIVGYVYTSPDGVEIPLKSRDVIFIRRPNPLDPYRGISPIGSTLAHIDGERYSAEWNRNFFLNGAQPGGIIEVGDKRLSESEFEELILRWREMHQGVNNAHRVGFLENGAKWVDVKLSQKDMDFTGLSQLSGEKIRESFGYPKPMLGSVEDVNRANAEAGEYVFAKWLLVHRLDRWKGAFNHDFLPLFGSVGEDLEFDYDSPVPADRTADNSERDSKVNAAKIMIDLGFDPKDVLIWLDIPDMSLIAEQGNKQQRDLVEAVQKVYLGVNTVVTADEARTILNTYGANLPVPGPFSPQPPAPGGSPPPTPGAGQNAQLMEIIRMMVAAREQHDGHGGHRHADGDHDDGEPWRARNATDAEPVQPPDPPDGVRPKLPKSAGPDLDPVQESWLQALDDLVAGWTNLTETWRTSILDQIAAKIAAGDIAGLANIRLPFAEAAALIEQAMLDLANDAADQVVTEARSQDVEITPAAPDRPRLAAVSQLLANVIQGNLINAALGEVLRIFRPSKSPDDVREAVRIHLESLTDAYPRLMLGAALSGAQHNGRVLTFANGPEAALYADEILDKNTCGPCRAVNRKWLGNATDAMVLDTYPFGGYVSCKGRQRCRGQVVAVWRGGSDWTKWVEMPEQRTAAS